MSYEDRQRVRDEEYCKAWEALPPSKREQLLNHGLTADCDRDPAPDRGRREVVGREHDASEDLETHGGVEVDYAEACDSLADKIQQEFGPMSRDQAERIAAFMAERAQAALIEQSSLILARIVGFFLLSSDNLQARAHALAHAARMAARNGLRSLRHSAEVCGVSPEWMRKVAWKWVEQLGLPPLEGAKSEEAREAYSKDKKTNHWRTKKCTQLPNLNPSNPDKIKLS
jgi:hypothetical protein